MHINFVIINPSYNKIFNHSRYKDIFDFIVYTHTNSYIYSNILIHKCILEILLLDNYFINLSINRLFIMTIIKSNQTF